MKKLLIMWLVVGPNVSYVLPQKDSISENLNEFCYVYSEWHQHTYRVFRQEGSIIKEQFRIRCVGEDTGNWKYQIVTSGSSS